MWYLIVSIPDLCTITYFKANVNSVVGKMDIESFIDLLTSTDSDVLRAIASFIYTANNT